ncbi:MAG: alpha/beta fold hydrolase [Halorientalis sp.]
METVSHDGRATAYRRTEFGTDSAPVLFVHGSGGTHDIWTAQYGRRDTGSPAVAVDLSGHGESAAIETAPGAETLDAYAADVHAVMDETGAELLVGNSLGGAVILHLALETAAEPVGLVLAGTGAKLGVHPDLKELLAADFEAAIDTLHGDDMLFHEAPPEQIDRSKAAMRSVGRTVTERDFLTCDAFDVRDRLDEIDVPVLALVGEYDSLTPVSYHEYLAAEIPAGELAVLDDAAHLAMIERPAAFNSAINEFHQRL